MYIERDTRKAAQGKEQQSGNEYLSKCLALFIRHTVQELPAILGKSITLHPKKESQGEESRENGDEMGTGKQGYTGSGWW